MTPLDRVAQAIGDRYRRQMGRSLPAGVADKLAESALASLGLLHEERTLTNGWVQPSYGFMRQQEIRAYEMAGLTPPEIPDPEIREQQRWVMPWEDR